MSKSRTLPLVTNTVFFKTLFVSGQAPGTIFYFLIIKNCSQTLMAHAHNPNNQLVEKGESGGQDHLDLKSECKERRKKRREEGKKKKEGREGNKEERKLSTDSLTKQVYFFSSTH